MSWSKVLRYAIALFMAGFAIGFFELSFEPSFSRLLGAAVATFIVYAAIFAHLAAHQASHPFANACAALLLQTAVATLIARTFIGWDSSHRFIEAIDWFVSVCALAAGMALGINLRRRSIRSTDA